MADKYPLTHLPAALVEAGYESPGYRAVYEAARDARIPAQPNRAGRWLFNPEDLPAIAEAMGLSDARAA